MTFADIPAGVDLFIDANIFVYYFSPDPALGPLCEKLLERVENGEIQGLTSASVLSDIAHRLMCLEACARFSWPPQGIANRLKRHPGEVQQLTRHRQALDEVTLFGVRVLEVNGVQVSRAADLSIQAGLLAGDGLIVAVMRSHGLVHLASHDADFDRVPGITRYAPS
jgi:predicted nucleic acid-binding protein